MLVSVKKQRQNLWIDEETQPEDEVEIALDFVGSPYENQGLSPLRASAHKEREECPPTRTSPQTPSPAPTNTQSLESEPCDEEAQILRAGRTNEVSEGDEYFMPSSYAGACDFVDREEETSQASKVSMANKLMSRGQKTKVQAPMAQGVKGHEEEPLVLSSKGGKAQKNWRWALFSVLVHVACVVALYVFAQAVLQGKFSFIFDSDTPVVEEKMTRVESFQTLEGDGGEAETTRTTRTTRTMPAAPADNKTSRPLVHMIDLEDVVPSQK